MGGSGDFDYAAYLKEQIAFWQQEAERLQASKRGTTSVGFTASGRFMGGASFKIELAQDMHNNVALLYTDSVDGGSPVAAITLDLAATNAHNVDELTNESLQIGGSIGTPVAVGAELMAGKDNSYFGVNLSFGLAGTPFAEGHGGVCNTKKIFRFKPRSLKEIYKDVQTYTHSGNKYPFYLGGS